MINIRMDAATMQAAIEGMQSNLSDLRPAWRQVHQVLLRFEREVFRSEGAYTGRPWQPLTPEYAARKQSRWGRRPILQASQRMFRSFTDAGHDEHVFEMTPTRMIFGSRVFYARYHQDGTRARRTGVPRTPLQRSASGQLMRRPGMAPRPPLPLITRAEGEQIVDILTAHALRRPTR